jgi:hypothetical protein
MFRPDGTPFDPRELDLVRNFSFSVNAPKR